MTIKTKIVATIGPSSNNKPTLEKLISAGLNVARLNFSHGSYEEHGKVIKLIRSLSKVINRPIGILLDLQGPKIRTGTLKAGEPVLLKRNTTFCITSKKIIGTADKVSTTYTKLPSDVKNNDRILLDDGLIELKVISKTKDQVTCKVINGGVLGEHKGINLPGVTVSAPSLTDKDKKDLNFGIKAGVDYFALSFVRHADDLRHIKSIISKQGQDIPVVAKIEKPEAVEHLDEILDVADAIMVARGDLGVEMSPEQVPTIQKRIIHAAIRCGKPVITATQMLESMTANPVPTRAEASDVANAIFDGTDAVMLSGETAVGKHPVAAVQMMVKIAEQAEKSPFMRYNILHEKDPEKLISQAIARSAVNIVQEIDPKGVIAFSESGKTSGQISTHRPNAMVYTFTPRREVYNRLSLVWGIIPFFLSHINDAERLIIASENILIEKEIARLDDIFVIVIGFGLKSGSTNLIKLHRVGRTD